jgi:hypothetical protein
MAKGILLTAVVLLACRDPQQRQKRASIDPVIADDAPPVAFGVDAAAPPADAAMLDASLADEAGPSDVLLTDDKQSVHLRWGRAFFGAEGFIVQLYSAPKSCDKFSPLDDEFTGSRVQFELLPGPGGRFFAGRPFGTDVLVRSDVIPLVLPPADVELRLQPFQTGKGQHIRGSIDAGMDILIGSASLKGSFDVEICDGPDEPVYALRASAPAQPASGRFDGKRLAPKAVHAIVRGMSASKDEAIDVAIKRKPRGSRDVIVGLAFYADAKLPCPAADHDYLKDPEPMIDFSGISGASSARPFLNAPQPMLGKTGDLPLHAWVTFDRLAFTQGATITGTLWAQPALVWDRKKGSFGGRFTATVCVQ